METIGIEVELPASDGTVGTHIRALREWATILRGGAGNVLYTGSGEVILQQWIEGQPGHQAKVSLKELRKLIRSALKGPPSKWVEMDLF